MDPVPQIFLLESQHFLLCLALCSGVTTVVLNKWLDVT